MKPFTVICEPQEVPFKYATNLQRPQSAGNGKKQESHGKRNSFRKKNEMNESFIYVHGLGESSVHAANRFNGR